MESTPPRLEAPRSEPPPQKHRWPAATLGSSILGSTMRRTVAVILPTLLLSFAACAQEPKPPVLRDAPQGGQQIGEEETRKLAQAMQKQLADEHIAVDAKAQTITIQAVMNQPPDPIEYLLIHKRGKRHEAVFITNSKPSVLNAAFLLLGFAPGKNATAKEKSPPPTL